MSVTENLTRWSDGKMSDREELSMPSVGQSPWGDAWPEGVWCWDEEADEVLIGACTDDAGILTYAEARARLGQ